MAKFALAASAAVAATVCIIFSYGGQTNPVAGFALPALMLFATRSSTRRDALLILIVCMIVGVNIAYWGPLQALDDVPLQIVVMTLAALLMSIPYAVDRILYDRVGGWQRILFFPFIMASFEVIMTLTPLGNINSLAYSQMGFLDSIQMVSVIGSTGLTFMICLFGSAVSHILIGYDKSCRIDRKAVFCIAVVIVAILAGTVRLATDVPSDGTVSVLCTEGPGVYISDTDKDKVPYESNIESFDRAVDIACSEGATVLFASEDAYRMDISRVDDFREHVEEKALETGLYILYCVGINEGSKQIWNVCSFVNPSGVTEWTYKKTHIMPVDEHCRYSGDGTLYYSDTEFGRISSVICVDLEFPAFVSGMDDDVDILMSPSYDWHGLEGWHTRNTSLRAVENGVSFIRNTSIGTIGVYDYLGHELEQITYRGDAQDCYLLEVPTCSCHTVFGAYGSIIVWLFVVGLMVLSVSAFYEARKVQRNAS